MRIALRTSGGRGEYELAGSQAGVSASSLLGRELQFEIRPDLVLASLQQAVHVQGKSRIRLTDKRNGIHAYRLLAGALAMPKPKRELAAASKSSDFVRDDQYVVSAIDVDVVRKSASDARLRPVSLVLENAAGAVRRLDFAERMALVQEVWNAAARQSSPLSHLAGLHEAAVLSARPKRIERASHDMRRALPGDGDVLGSIAEALGLEIDIPPAAAGLRSSKDLVQDETDETTPQEAKRETVAKWRRTVARTAAARKFSKEVRAAYRNRCAVCGKRLPRLSSTASAGVAGAHILPWAKYELNDVRNGLCLDALCHWAFDAGLIRIAWDGQAYVVSIPESIRADARTQRMDLAYFESFVGPIPNDRLPDDPSQHPSPACLEALAQMMFG